MDAISKFALIVLLLCGADQVYLFFQRLISICHSMTKFYFRKEILLIPENISSRLLSRYRWRRTRICSTCRTAKSKKHITDLQKVKFPKSYSPPSPRIKESLLSLVWLFFSVCFQMFPQTVWPRTCIITLVAFVWLFSTVRFECQCLLLCRATGTRGDIAIPVIRETNTLHIQLQ